MDRCTTMRTHSTHTTESQRPSASPHCFLPTKDLYKGEIHALTEPNMTSARPDDLRHGDHELSTCTGAAPACVAWRGVHTLARAAKHTRLNAT